MRYKSIPVILCCSRALWHCVGRTAKKYYFDTFLCAVVKKTHGRALLLKLTQKLPINNCCALHRSTRWPPTTPVCRRVCEEQKKFNSPRFILIAHTCANTNCAFHSLCRVCVCILCTIIIIICFEFLYKH